MYPLVLAGNDEADFVHCPSRDSFPIARATEENRALTTLQAFHYAASGRITINGNTDACQIEKSSLQSGMTRINREKTHPA